MHAPKEGPAQTWAITMSEAVYASIKTQAAFNELVTLVMVPLMPVSSP